MTHDKQVAVVQTTTDYAKFKDLAGNRTINPLHVKRLGRSFKEDYLLSPIIVNERFEIIDGQHRFAAAQAERLPVNYIMAEGYRLPQVQRLNTGTSNWRKVDYLRSYADLGILPYVQMRRFMEEFPQLGIAACECLLTQNVHGANNKQHENGGSKARKKGFQNGDLEIVDLDFAYEAATKIVKMAPLYDGFNRTTFVRAVSLLMQKAVFDVDFFISKLDTNTGRFGHRGSIGEYVELVEELYNFRSRSKVNLRF
jgi:hypothetical protein